MSVFEETINKLIYDNDVKELFRFQGHNSKNFFDVKNNDFSSNPDDRYYYFSASLTHHKYFSVRRIRQLVNYILSETPYSLSQKYIRDKETFDEILKLVSNSEKIKDINCIKLVYDNSYYDLISENYCYNDASKKENMVERVDRRFFGGGYGFSNEWLRLLECLTFFSSYIRFDEVNIEKVLRSMKKNGNVTSIYNIDFLKYENYKINGYVLDNFTKYQIIELMENIIEKDLVKKGSQLQKYPTVTIKRTVDTYQKNKDKMLTLFEKHYGKL